MRVRVRYSKLEKVRFISAIDMGRIWERSLRRADLPIAYSEGFSPHPKVSFPDALTLGYASTGEYAELTFVDGFDVLTAIPALNAALPAGMDVLDAVEVADGAPRLSKWLQASLWDIAYPDDAPERAAAVEEIMAAATVIVGRERKDEITDVDIRPAIAQLQSVGRGGGPGGVRVVLQHSEPPIRPQEIHEALAQRLAPEHLSQPVLVTRIAQGRVSNDGVIEAISGAPVPLDTPARQKATT